MEHEIDIYSLFNTQRPVQTLFFHSSGLILKTIDDYKKYESAFSWVNINDIVQRIERITKQTGKDKKSLIVVSGRSKQIREFLNVDEGFIPTVGEL